MARERKDKNKKNGIQEDSDLEECGEEDIGEYLQHTQSNQERLRVRRDYRKILDHLSKNKHDMVNPESNQLAEVLEDVNVLNKQVRMPREGALDSQAILMISNLGRQRADALNTDFVRFEPVEFAEKLIRFFGGDEGDVRITPQGWITLGAAVQKFFCRSPAFHFMCGSFERGERPVKQKPIKPTKDKDNENQGRPTVPSNVKDIDKISSDKNEATTAEVERVLSILQRCYDQNDENPVCYFEFVLNPYCFGQTVENMFYTSFLIRDGHAKMSLDEDGLPLIEPVATVEGEHAQENRRHHQAVVSITPLEWKDLVEAFEVTEPLIPTREHSSPSRYVLNDSTSKSTSNNCDVSSSKVKKSKKKS